MNDASEARTSGAEESAWPQFVTLLRERVPGLPPDVSPNTRISELDSGDRIVKGLLSASIRVLLRDPPADLLNSITTLGEVSEWFAVRQDLGGNEIRAGAHEEAMKAMSTLSVRLRPVAESDLPEIYASALDPRWSYRWRFHGATPSFSEFSSSLWSGVLSQFVVERHADHRAAGLVVCYNARPDVGWAYIAFVRTAAPTSAFGSEMLEGGYLFISFLFRQWSFHKLYSEVPGYNWDMFEKAQGQYFQLEGTLSDHDYFDGRYWDQRIVALDRSTWQADAVPLLSSLYCTPAST